MSEYQCTECGVIHMQGDFCDPDWRESFTRSGVGTSESVA